MTDIIQTGFEEAKKLLHSTSTDKGFSASLGGLYDNEVWGRDGSIICLGVHRCEDSRLMESSRTTLSTLKQMQSSLGQVPNRVRIAPLSVNFYSLDASSWWIIAVTSYWRVTNDRKFISEFWPSLKKAITWLKYRDTDGTGLLTSPPAADWMDSSLQRWGIVFYNNVLYYRALQCIAEVAQALGEEEDESREAQRVKARMNILFWPETRVAPDEWISGWNTKFYEEVVDSHRVHYLSFLSFESYDWNCDVAGNVLAILWDIADARQTERILQYISDSGLADPFPIRVLAPPLLYPTPSWNPKIDLYRPGQQQNLPFQYHNAAIWPWVGGLYILVLEKTGRHDQAREELLKLARANSLGEQQEWEFNEWLHGRTGAPLGTRFQSWSASGYLMAHKAVMDQLQTV